MALKIRLARGGSKKRPYYRIVVAEASAPRDGRFIEKIGNYNPMLPSDHQDRVRLDEGRAKHWLSVGAKPTDRVERFLVARGLCEATNKNNPQKAQPKQKAQERMKAAEEAARAAKEAEEAAKAEAKAAEEAAKAEAKAAKEAEAAAKAEAEAAPQEEAPTEGQAEPKQDA